MMSSQENDVNVEQWKIKRLIKNLDEAKGNHTSMISLILPPKEQLARINKMLTEEQGTAANIKSSVNKKSVLAAITSVKERLKLYKEVPDQGLVVYSGNVISEDGRSEKKYTIDFEPFRPVTQFMYYCDNKFHTEQLKELLEDDEKFGFIVMDGNGCLYGTLQGNNREILQKISVDLPKKHSKGGQSSVRFARLREEKRHNYVRKVAELATVHFINVDRPNIAGLVLAGSANFKKELSTSDLFDARLVPIIVKIVDISYGAENGFNQAITLAQDALSNVKFVAEKKLIGKFFEEISLDSGMVVSGVEDTLKALEISAAETLMIFENLDINRYELKNPATEEIKIAFLNTSQQKDPRYFRDEANGVDLEVIEMKQLTECFNRLCENYHSFGAKLEFVTDKSQEGFQFSKGFGGIGAFLRYKVDLDQIDLGNHEDQDGFDTDEDFI